MFAPDAADTWLISQLPLELIELWRAIDGQPLPDSSWKALRPEELVIPGFRLMSLSEVAAELCGQGVTDETPSFAAGGGGLGGDWPSALASCICSLSRSLVCLCVCVSVRLCLCVCSLCFTHVDRSR